MALAVHQKIIYVILSYIKYFFEGDNVNGKFGKLFEPIKIGSVEIKNKISMAPMGILGLATEKGGFTKRAQDYYAARARGGTGLFITSVAKIENEMKNFTMDFFVQQLMLDIL